MARDDAPPVPMHLKVEAFDDFEEGADDAVADEVFHQLPPDPGLVHHDLAVSELVELPMDAIDDLEELEALEDDPFEELLDEQGTQDAPRPAASVPARRRRSSLLLDPGPLPEPPKPRRDNVHWRMVAAFLVSMVVTMLLTFLPWMLIGSPALKQMRDNAAAARQPKIVEVPKPVMVEKLVPVPAVAAPAPAEPAEPEPVVAAAPVVRPTPRARPRPKARPRPRATKPAPAPAPQPVAPAPVVEAPPPPAPAKTPPEALALNGKVRGKAGGDSLYADVIFKARGRAIMHVKRGDNPWVTARGSYTLSNGSATLNVAEPGDGAKYTINLNGSGATGQMVLPNGKSKNVKASR